MTDQKLLNAIILIENYISTDRIGEIEFTISEDWRDSGLPVVDVQVNDKDGNGIFGDLNFDTFGEALISVADNLYQRD